VVAKLNSRGQPEEVLPSELLESLSESEDDDDPESEDESLSESEELESLWCLRLLRGAAEGLDGAAWSSGSTSVGSMNLGRHCSNTSCQGIQYNYIGSSKLVCTC